MMMETLACRDGLAAAKEWGVLNLILETYCQEVATLWASWLYQRSYLAPLFRELKELSVSF